MLPYLTPEFPGVGGVIKQRSEDFFVQEIPLYEPSGSGEHVYCEIQKVGLTTFEAMHRLGKALDISTRDIGYAGMKDAHAITRQIFSIAGTTPEAVMSLQIPGITIQWAARHGNKLRLGHLQGNRFAIKNPRSESDRRCEDQTGAGDDRAPRHAKLFRRAAVWPAQQQRSAGSCPHPRRP